MTSIYHEYVPAEGSCSTCGADLVTRIEKFDAWQEKGVERGRYTECREDSSHKV